jgi:hypothetical protein
MSVSSGSRGGASLEAPKNDHIPIPKNKWTKLPDNSQISYLRNDGKMVKSAFVKVIYNKNGEDYIMCGSKLNKFPGDKYYTEYRLKLSSVKSLWKKISQDSIIEYKLIKAKLEMELNTMKNKIEELEERLKKEEDSSKKIVKLIKHLHNIKNLDELKNK